jgi:uncharacterized membrane protein SirB2
LETFYPQILMVHISAVLLSGGLFFTRAAASNIFGAPWIMAAPLRYLSYSIDTVLLTAALMLMTVTHQYPFVDAWLTTKVVLLVVYVLLGSFALKRARDRTSRLLCSAAAVAIFAFVISVALTHNPLGIFAGVIGRS